MMTNFSLCASLAFATLGSQSKSTDYTDLARQYTLSIASAHDNLTIIATVKRAQPTLYTAWHIKTQAYAQSISSISEDLHHIRRAAFSAAQDSVPATDSDAAPVDADDPVNWRAPASTWDATLRMLQMRLAQLGDGDLALLKQHASDLLKLLSELPAAVDLPPEQPLSLPSSIAQGLLAGNVTATAAAQLAARGAAWVPADAPSAGSWPANLRAGIAQAAVASAAAGLVPVLAAHNALHEVAASSHLSGALPTATSSLAAAAALAAGIGAVHGGACSTAAVAAAARAAGQPAAADLCDGRRLVGPAGDVRHARDLAERGGLPRLLSCVEANQATVSLCSALYSGALPPWAAGLPLCAPAQHAEAEAAPSGVAQLVALAATAPWRAVSDHAPVQTSGIGIPPVHLRAAPGVLLLWQGWHAAQQGKAVVALEKWQAAVQGAQAGSAVAMFAELSQLDLQLHGWHVLSGASQSSLPGSPSDFRAATPDLQRRCGAALEQAHGHKNCSVQAYAWLVAARCAAAAQLPGAAASALQCGARQAASIGDAYLQARCASTQAALGISGAAESASQLWTQLRRTAQ